MESDLLFFHGPTELDRTGDVSVLEHLPKCHHCPVVFEYVLQYTGHNEDDAVKKHLWSKEDYASILAIDWVFFF